MGERIRSELRPGDFAARRSIDEFAVALWDAEKRRQPDSEHPHDPLELAERFCRTIAGHDFKCLGDTAPGPVTVSGGLASFPWHGMTREALMSCADAALREAKRSGKNHIKLAGRVENASSQERSSFASNAANLGPPHPADGRA